MERLIRETIEGLKATAIEKICVLGPEDARKYIDQLEEVTEDLVMFWNLDERYIDEFKETVMTLEKQF